MDTFWTIVVVLVVLWALGLIGGFGGGLIHILLVIAVLIAVYRLAQGRNMLTGR
ncbi:MAG: lmo0937 family membrane protein [archaeon]|nr:lmo0937 family membrane protein [archaeon]